MTIKDLENQKPDVLLAIDDKKSDGNFGFAVCTSVCSFTGSKGLGD